MFQCVQRPGDVKVRPKINCQDESSADPSYFSITYFSSPFPPLYLLNKGYHKSSPRNQVMLKVPWGFPVKTIMTLKLSKKKK